MADLDNLEDMLAALDTPSSQSNYDQGRSERADPMAQVDDIDNFLDSLVDLPASTPIRSNVSVPAPSMDDFESLTNAPVDSGDPDASAHEAHANQHWFATTIEAEYRSPTEAAAAFEKNGYSIHINKGKFINYQGGTASDFRLKGTTSTKVGYIHAITLRSLDDYGAPANITGPRDFIGCSFSHRQSGDDIQCWFRDNGDSTYDLAFYAAKPGVIQMQIKLCGNPMFDIDIQVEQPGRSLWIARPQLPAEPGKRFLIDIVTEDGSKPEGVAPFEVQSMGDVEELKLFNNGDGSYRFSCMPMANGFITIQLTLHGQPIKGSPVTVQVGQKTGVYVKQQSRGLTDEKAIPGITQSLPPQQPVVSRSMGAVPVSSARPSVAPMIIEAQPMRDSTYSPGDTFQPRESTVSQVTNDDLNALLDELGG